MKLLQVTNIVSHHQLPLARELVSLLGADNVRFASVKPPDQQRLSMGWSNDEINPWILRVAENQTDRREFDRWWREADVVLSGEVMFDKMIKRLSSGRWCLYMSERWCRPPFGGLRLLSPAFLRRAHQIRSLAGSRYFYYLAIGPFAADDISRITNFRGGVLQWGYFPPLQLGQVPSLSAKRGFHVLWAGRMLRFKRVDTLIRAVGRLHKDGLGVDLTLVGDGPLRDKLQGLAADVLKPGRYRFLGPVAAETVPALMLDHHVYALTSSGGEGWGAVTNEAMACGRAVVGSDMAGSVAAMIRHEDNGLIFESGNVDSLASQLRRLYFDRDLLDAVGSAASKTIDEIWSARVAAGRLVEFCSSLLHCGRLPAYVSGPLSPARL